MMPTKITPKNVTDYPKGTILEFNFGAYYPTMYGEVTGFEIIPETKWFPEQARLIAEYFDPIEEEMVSTTVETFVDIGIGVYLIEIRGQCVNFNSPWKETA